MMRTLGVQNPNAWDVSPLFSQSLNGDHGDWEYYGTIIPNYEDWWVVGGGWWGVVGVVVGGGVGGGGGGGSWGGLRVNITPLRHKGFRVRGWGSGDLGHMAKAV